MPIRWTLREYLASIGVTPYKLAKTLDMSMATMYRLLANPVPKQIDNERLGEFITALRAMGHDTQITDVLEFVEFEDQA